MNKKIYDKVCEFKSVDELIAYSKEIKEPLTKEEATKVFNKVKEHNKMNDDDLDNVSGGTGGKVFSVGDDDEVEPFFPKHLAGEKVVWSTGDGNDEGVIIDVQKGKVSSFSIDPDVQYTIRRKDGTIVKGVSHTRIL